MCHERIDRAWERTTDRATADEENGEDEDLPAFLNEEGGDLEVLTDGGDGA